MSEWKLTTLGDLGRWRTGKTPRTAEPANWGEGVEFVTPGDLGSGGELGSVARTISKTGVSGSVLFSAPSVLLGCIGTIGKVNWSPRPVASNQQINGLEVNQEIADAQFVSWLLASAGMQEKLWAESSRTTVAIVNRTKLERIVVSLPPLDEQKRIVAKLDQVHSEVWNLTSHLDGQREATRSLEKSFLKDRLGLRGLSSGQFGLNDSEPSPKWQERPLASLCKIQTGKRDANEGDPEGQYHFFTCARDHSFIDTYKFDTEALLIAGNGDVGAVKYFSGKFDAYQRTYVLTDFKGVLPRFLFRVLNGLLRDQLAPQKLGNTMPYIRVGMLENFSVPLPSIAEQESLLAELEGFAMAREKLEATHSKQLSLVSAFQAATLSAALVGDI